MESGWLRIAQTDPDRVGQIMEDGNLHRGEAEVIEAATRIDFFNSTILVDEARAFRYATIRTELVVFSLPQMLHQLERQGDLASCREVMEILVASGTYRWAKRARQHYVTWCAREGLEPV